MERVIRIDCDECEHQFSAVCDDCLVTFLCGPEGERNDAVVIPIQEWRTVTMLQRGGLAPELRHLTYGP